MKYIILIIAISLVSFETNNIEENKVKQKPVPSKIEQCLNAQIMFMEAGVSEKKARDYAVKTDSSCVCLDTLKSNND